MINKVPSLDSKYQTLSWATILFCEFKCSKVWIPQKIQQLHVQIWPWPSYCSLNHGLRQASLHQSPLDLMNVWIHAYEVSSEEASDGDGLCTLFFICSLLSCSISSLEPRNNQETPSGTTNWCKCRPNLELSSWRCVFSRCFWNTKPYHIHTYSWPKHI